MILCADIEAYSIKYFKKNKKIKSYSHLAKSLDGSVTIFDVDLKQFFLKIINLSKKEKDIKIYFHNGGDYDFHFFWKTIEDLQKEKKIDRYEYFMNKKHTAFNIKLIKQERIYFPKYIKKNNIKITLLDSAKIFPMKLAEMGKVVNLPKLDIDEYDIDTEFNSNLEYINFNSGRDYEYLNRDVDIMVAFLNFIETSSFLKLDDFKNTIASTAMNMFKKFNLSDFKKLENTNVLLNVNSWNELKRAYWGGFTYLNPSFTLKQTESYIYDINSLYPSVMEDELMPYGEIYDGDQEGSSFKILKVELNYGRAKIIPFIPINTKYLTEFKNYTLYIHSDMFSVMEKYYELDIKSVEVIYSCKEKKGVFNKYVSFFKEMKKWGEDNNNPVIRKVAKLLSNSLYGKWGESIVDQQSFITNDDSAFEYNNKGTDKETIWYKQEGIIDGSKSRVRRISDNLFIYKQNNGYIDEYRIRNIAVAIKITSTARIRLVKAIIKNIDNFIYCDTDSVHTTKEAVGLDIDPFRYGAWKFEGYWETSIYRRTKHYLHINGNDYDLKGGGFNVSKFNRTREITKEIYKMKNPPALKNGKMFKAFVNGGIILWEGDYIFTDPWKEDIQIEE